MCCSRLGRRSVGGHSRAKSPRHKFLVAEPQKPPAMIRVRLFNVGLHFFAAKVAFSYPSMDRFGNFFGTYYLVGQVKSVPNFC